MNTSLRNKVAGVLSATVLVFAAAGATPALAAHVHGGGHSGGFHGGGRGFAGHGGFHGGRFAGRGYRGGYGGWGGGYAGYGGYYGGGYYCNPAMVIFNPQMCL